MAFVDLLLDDTDIKSENSDGNQDPDSQTTLSSNLDEDKMRSVVEDSNQQEENTNDVKSHEDVNKDAPHDRGKKAEGDNLKKKYCCKRCSYSSYILSNFRTHMLVHSGEKPHVCKFCQKAFRQKSHLQSHERSHTGQHPYKCDECSSDFVQKSSLNFHKKKHARKTAALTMLKLKGEITDDSDDSAEWDAVKPFWADLTDDDRRNKTTKNRTYTCRHCGTSSQTFSNFKKHVMIHYGSRPYKCDMCEKSFRQKHHLEDHRRIHTGERPYECEKCDKAFSQRSSLNLHKKKHSGIKPYKCELCDHSTYEKLHLVIHMRKHTGEKPFQCEICGVSFSSLSRLRYHRMIHTGERRYECEECGVKFREKVTLQKHRGTHINKGPFPCEDCGREYPRLASLTLHRKVHTNSEAYFNKVLGKRGSDASQIAVPGTSSLVEATTQGSDASQIAVPGTSSLVEATTQQTNVADSDETSSPKKRKLKFTDDVDETPTSSDKSRELNCNTDKQDDNPGVSCTNQVQQNASGVSGRSCIKLSPMRRASPKKLKLRRNRDIRKDDMEDINFQAQKTIVSDQTGETCHSRENFQKKMQAKSTLQNLVDSLPAEASGKTEYVRAALQSGTVVESQDTAGNEFFIVLPPALKNRDISILPPANTETSVPMLMPADPQAVQLVRADSHADNITSGVITREARERTENVEGIEAVFHQSDIGRESEEAGTTVETEFYQDDCSDSIDIVEGEVVEDDSEDCPLEVGELQIVDTSSSKAAHVCPGAVVKNTTDTHSYLGAQEEIYAEAVESLWDEKREDDIAVMYVIGGDHEDPFTFSQMKVQKGKDPLTGKSDQVNNDGITDRAETEMVKPKRKRKAKASESPLNSAKKKMKLKSDSDDAVEMGMQKSNMTTKGKENKANTTKRVRIKRDPNDIQMRPRKREKVKVPKERKARKTERDFDCLQCGKECRTSSNYIAHMRTHTGERPYFCDVCGMAFKQISHLRAHVRIHTGEKPYVCDICNIAYTQSSRLNAHKKTKHGDGAIERQKKVKPVKESKVRNFFCKVCNKTFINECFKTEHRRSHHMPSASYVCSICGAIYKSKGSLNKHRRKHNDNKCICELCGAVFSDLPSLQNHRVTQHEASITENHEDTQHRAGFTEPSMLEMRINVRIGEEKDFVVINTSIKKEDKDVTGDNADDARVTDEMEPIVPSGECEVKTEIDSEVCSMDAEDDTSKDSTSKAERKEDAVSVQARGDCRNSLVNSNDCNVTDTELRGPDSSEPVMENITENIKKEITEGTNEEITGTNQVSCETGKKEWVCKNCDKVFSQSSSLKSHMKIHIERKFQCEVCSKVFLQSSNLKAHMRMHTGERPYQCNMCPRAFKQINHLKDHVYRHSSIKPFSCGECGAPFTQRTAIALHIKKFHENGAEIVKNTAGFEKIGSEGESKIPVVRYTRRRTKEKQVVTGKKIMTKEKCRVCSQVYSSGYLKIHERCHTGERPYKCSFCSETFKQKSHMQYHEFRHTGERRFSCWKCNASFIQSHNYNRHISKCTEKGEKGLGDRKGRTYQCVCGITFRTYYLLVKHEKFCSVAVDSDISYDSDEDQIPYDDDDEDVFDLSEDSLDDDELDILPVKRMSSRGKIKIKRSGKQIKGKQQRKNANTRGSKKTDKTAVKTKSSPKRIVKELICQCCSIAFKNIAQYKTHLLKKGIVDKVCDECGETFKRASALKFHQNMKHGGTYDR